MLRAGCSRHRPVRLPKRLSRRTLLRQCGALGGGLGLAPGWPWASDAAPVVRVAPPTITRDGCTAVVSVQVTIVPAKPGLRYVVHGELWEGDDPDGDPDFAGALEPYETPPLPAESVPILLHGRFLAAALGLEKGVGPASDEAYSPDLAELYARVTMRDQASGIDFGPWDSPVRVAVAEETRDWTGTQRVPSSNDLLLPRGGRGAEKPPRACTA